MEFSELPVGFGMALNQNTAAMIRFAQLPAQKKQALLNRAASIETKTEMYALVAELANGNM